MIDYPNDNPEFLDQDQPNRFAGVEPIAASVSSETDDAQSNDDNGQDYQPACPQLVSTLRFLNFGFDVEAKNNVTGERVEFNDTSISPRAYFKKNSEHFPVARLPSGIIALVAEDKTILLKYLEPLETPPVVMLRNGNKFAALLKLGATATDKGAKLSLPDDITLVSPGQTITLPYGENLELSTIGVTDCNCLPALPSDAYDVPFDPDYHNVPFDALSYLTRQRLQANESDVEPKTLTVEVEVAELNEERISSNADIEGLTLDQSEAEPPAVVVIDKEISVPDTPLTKHSLLGSEDDVARYAVTAIALIGRVLLLGQFGMIYAEPNTGKTLLVIALLLNAIEEGRLDARMLYYVNADDNAGGLLEKLQLFREVGAHTLVPGYKGFEPENLIDLMLTMIKNRQCVGVVLVVDTLKNFTDLMDKKKSAQFGRVARRFQNAGGTFIGLAHTNKKPGANGKPVYAGTTDFLEACDVACYILPVKTAPNGDKVVKFELFKRRGGGNQNEAYTFSGASDISYHHLVASVQKVDADQMQEHERAGQVIADKSVIDGICDVLKDGPQQKMALARTVAGLTKASRRQVVEILERYTGSDPAKHKWDFVVAERGAKVFALHPLVDA